MTRILVIGAGPAGCAAAIALAKRRHDVVMIDRCSDAASAKLPETLFPATRQTLRELNIDVNETLPSEVGFVSGDGEASLTLRLDDMAGGCAYIDRNRLDAKLRSEALAAGARAIETQAIQSAQRRGREFVVTAADGATFVAPFLIDASGKAQLAAPLVGGLLIDPHQLDPRQNVFAHFESERGFGLKRITIIRTDDGFFYAAPIRDNRISLGWVSYAAPASDECETAFLTQIAATKAAKTLVGDARRVTPVITAKNNATRVVRPAADGVFVVGDALGFCDPFFRDGIGFALASGRLAGERCADVIAEACSPVEAEARYAADIARAEATLCSSTEAAIKRTRDLFAPTQILDPHMPGAILAALTGLTFGASGATRSVVQARRDNAPVWEAMI